MITDFVRGVYQSDQTQYCQTGWQVGKEHYYQLKNIKRMKEESDMKDQLSLRTATSPCCRGEEMESIWADGGCRS